MRIGYPLFIYTQCEIRIRLRPYALFLREEYSINIKQKNNHKK